MLAALTIPAGLREVIDILIVASLAVAVVVGYLLWTFVKGAGYEPVPTKALTRMIELSRPGPGKRVYDLGSGFGRVILHVAESTGATCVGVEVDPLKVWWTRRRIAAKGLSKQVELIKADLLAVDLSSADIVFVFLWGGIMQKLKEKAMKEMKPGSVIVSYYHQFNGWAADREDARGRVYLYKIPG